MKADVELEREGDSEIFHDLARYLKYHPQLTRFLFNPAGFTFLFGVVLYLGMIIGWAALLAVDAEAAGAAAATAGTQIFFGKEIAIPLGILEFGLHAGLVLGIVFMQDLVTTSWVYPAFYIFRKRHLGRDNFAGYFFSRVEKKAEEHRPFTEKYGAAGLFVFMLVPFAVNGPLIGAIVGKLAGIRTRYILPTVVLATLVTTVMWTALVVYARVQLETFEQVIHPRWITLGIVALVLSIVAISFVGFVRDHRKFQELKAQREALARQAHVPAATPEPSPTPATAAMSDPPPGQPTPK